MLQIILAVKLIVNHSLMGGKTIDQGSKRTTSEGVDRSPHIETMPVQRYPPVTDCCLMTTITKSYINYISYSVSYCLMTVKYLFKLFFILFLFNMVFKLINMSWELCETYPE